MKEIILIDDMSDKVEFPKLGHDLEVELSKLDRVRLIRTKKREGLVRARLLGAEVAKGNLHIECSPCLTTFYTNRRSIDLFGLSY